MSFIAPLWRTPLRSRGSIAAAAWPLRSRLSLSRHAVRHIAVPSREAPGDVGVRDLRNIGIIAHVDAGKTTTTEQMLYNSGATRHAGNVDHGDTVTDFLPMERQRGITIQSAAITFPWPPQERLGPGERSNVINLIDTPGHVDFRFEVERCMPVLDGAVCVIDGVEGVEAHTERVWASANEFKVPRIIFVNKLDREGASFKKSIQDIGVKLNGMPLVCQIPWWSQDTVKGIVDVIEGTVVSWAGTKDKPEDLSVHKVEGTLKDECDTAREKLVELLCEKDDDLLEKWTEMGKDLPSADIKNSIRRIINDGHGSLIPVFAGSSLKNIGVASLLNAVNEYLPSPQDRPELEVRIGKEQQSLTKALSSTTSNKKNAPKVEALASVFKVVNDPVRGMLTFVRVYYGNLRKNMSMWNTNLQEFERPLNMLQIAGGKTIEIPHISTGSIGAITGLKAARTGDTLLTFSTPKAPASLVSTIQVRPPDIPPAVAFMFVEAYTPTGARALETALQNASREDPSLRWSLDEKTEQYTLSGMGTLHLEVARDRLENHYKVEAIWGKIAVDYKECLSQATPPTAAAFDKVVAGKAGKAGCTVVVEPFTDEDREALAGSFIERDGNIIKIDIIDSQDSGTSTSEDFDAHGIRQQLTNGAIAALTRGPRRSSPMHQCLVTVTFDTSTDYFGPAPGHTASAASKAVRLALKDAHDKGHIGIMEPVMKTTISCPDAAAEAVQHDLHSARGGHVLEVRDLADDSMREGSDVFLSDIYAPPDPYEFQTTLRDTQRGRMRMLQIVAKVPLAEMLDYDGVLRSKTKGRHTLTMELESFEKVTGAREKNL
ncbi:P-loop containing nucleoside triphosphate hydrolase protein [Microdochium trichocladiopsis]|uniref:P-loop containing nucleoside triphosphate hydrolase protein n=1 Tax=Microdochium trichocladiopsis TaxID=1682393 RepID=A0A9P8Y914_9PEZI|nr:P-loop containing nucleoside triphosphate hydrolase protein [Microdochium trichocladiopsis]KAH7030915.1 P-loop containing nucleoside triphosphate hydrolase protein [Microdochium trichocladiopsis]